MKRIIASISILFFFCLPELKAQFYSWGNDSGLRPLSEIKTENYRVIYPRGLDSLARVYAVNLERWYPVVGKTAGYEPNQNYKRPLPVVLHTTTSWSNGMVCWSPRRMELMTVPDAGSPMSLPWETHLTVHESRHLSQMQVGTEKPYKWLYWLTGEIWPSVMSSLYFGSVFDEGDAVDAETKLTLSGRGRNADFLEYYHYGLLNGDDRDWWQWRNGSLDKYTPDYYTIGYLTMSGLEKRYNRPELPKEYFNRVSSGWPFPILTFNRMVKEMSGKNFNDTFTEMKDSLRAEWTRADAARAPYTPAEKITEGDTLSVTFGGHTVALGNRLFAFRHAQDEVSTLVEILGKGRYKRLTLMSPTNGGLMYDETLERFYWTESIADIRWDLKSQSIIRYMDKKGRKRDLTKKGRYYNLQPYEDGKSLLVARYDENGRTAIVVVDAITGEELEVYMAPDGMQVVEAVSIDGRIYTSAIVERGCGFYEVTDSYRCVMEPTISNIKNVQAEQNLLWFTCDDRGVNEFYSLDPLSGEVCRRNSLQYGGSDFNFSRDSVYYSAYTREGRMIFGFNRADMVNVPTELRKAPEGKATTAQADIEVKMSEPKKYFRSAHLMKFHSWAPVYFKADAVDDISMDFFSKNAGLGVTAMFQDELSTMNGWVGFSGWTADGGWRPALHGKLSYTGLYPVFEANLDWNHSDRLRYFIQDKKVKIAHLGEGELSGRVRTYLPLRYNRGAWLTGFIPQFDFNFTNDYFDHGGRKPMHYLTTSIRGYAMLRRPESSMYPRYGIGAEIGYQCHPWLQNILITQKYAYLYGYLPGILRCHGIRLSALYNRYDQDKLTATFSYALPFAPVEWSGLEPILFVKNFELVARAKYVACSKTEDIPSAGIDLTAVIGPTRILPGDAHVGFALDFFPTLPQKATIGLLFSVDL